MTETWEERFFHLKHAVACAIYDEDWEKIKDFIRTEIEKKDKEHEILVNTILETKNREIEKVTKR